MRGEGGRVNSKKLKKKRNIYPLTNHYTLVYTSQSETMSNPRPNGSIDVTKELTPEELAQARAIHERRAKSDERDIPKNWKPKYTAILTLTQRGWEVKDIAVKLKVSKDTVFRVQSMELFQQKLMALTKRIEHRTYGKLVEQESDKNLDKAREHLAKYAMRAARKVTAIIRKGTPADRIKLDAAKDVLDRTGIKPNTVIETHQRVYAPDEVNSAKETLTELETHLNRISNQDSPYLLKGPKGSATDKASRLTTDTSPPDIPLDEDSVGQSTSSPS